MKRPRILPVVAVALALACRPILAATPAQYDQALSQVQSAIAAQVGALHSGGSLPTAQRPANVAARALAPIINVERPGHPAQPVNERLLLAALTAVDRPTPAPARLSQLQALNDQIVALRHDLQAPAPEHGSRVAGQSAVAAAHEVLSENLYESDPLPPPGLLDRFVNWLERILSRLFRPRHAPTAPPPINPVFIKGLLIALLAGAFAVLVAVLVQWLRRRLPRAQPLALDETEAALVEARDTDSLRALAEQKASQGDYRLALRFIYLALLVALDTDGVLRFDRSKTNWEYLRALRASGRADVYETMAPLTRDFDRIWYGFAATDSGDYARALAQYDALRAVSNAPAGRQTPATA